MENGRASDALPEKPASRLRTIDQRLGAIPHSFEKCVSNVSVT